MRRPSAILVLFSAVLLAGCEVSARSPNSEQGEQSGAPVVQSPGRVTVPEGATLALILETALSSATSRSGDRVLATLAEDLRVGDRVVLPAGTEVRGLVTEAAASGRVKGEARLAFDFDTLVVEGHEHPIGTSAVEITAANSHKKDAATIGIGAGAGALIGAIVDGKKGAGIGGLIGGATGTGVVLTTRGEEIVLSSGTRVTVRLVRAARL